MLALEKYILKKLVMIMSIFCMALLFSACGSEAPKAKEGAPQRVTLEYPPTMQARGFKEAVVLPQKPQRVISLTVSPVMALHELGVKQVGVPDTKILPLPEDLAKDAVKYSVAMRDNFDIEGVVAQQPDLVLVGYYAKEKYGQLLEKQKIPVYYVDAGPTVDYTSVKELTLALVNAFGADSEAGKKIKDRFAKVEERMSKFSAAHHGKTVMALQSAPPQHYIQTAQGNMGSMANMLGYANVYHNSKSRMVLLDKEQALSYKPDLLLSAGMGMTAESHREIMEAEFKTNEPYWQQIKAVREGNVVYLPSKYIISTGVNVIDDLNELMDILEARKL